MCSYFVRSREDLETLEKYSLMKLQSTLSVNENLNRDLITQSYLIFRISQRHFAKLKIFYILFKFKRKLMKKLIADKSFKNKKNLQRKYMIL